MRWLLIVCMACSSEEIGKRADKASVDPADYTLTLQQAEMAIEAHTGPGCLRMFPYVACRGCVAKYRLEPIEAGDAVGPCERSTFVAGSEVTTANAPQGKTYTWTCNGGALGGTWNNGSSDSTGALICRD